MGLVQREDFEAISTFIMKFMVGKVEEKCVHSIDHVAWTIVSRKLVEAMHT